MPIPSSQNLKPWQRSIRFFKMDNGSEFGSHDFNNFCSQEGIQIQYTTPYTPQQNGVVDRRNQIIMEMARCMLENKLIPHKYWVEVVHIVVDFLNGSPTKFVPTMTLEEAWSRKKPPLSHLKVLVQFLMYGFLKRSAVSWIQNARNLCLHGIMTIIKLID